MTSSPFGLEWSDVIGAALAIAALVWVVLRARGPGARQVVFGLGVVFSLVAIGEWGRVFPDGWRLARFWPEAALVAVILLQPEIRKALATIGRLHIPRAAEPDVRRAVEEVVRAAVALANRRIGALIVIERTQELSDAIDVGTTIDARISKELLISVFLPYSPLHDGAVIIRRHRIAAAGCFLPLSARLPAGEAAGTGTRHRAAVGITEDTDALAIVISEESGTMSLVTAGEIDRELDGDALRQRLAQSLGTEAQPIERWRWLSRARS